MTCPPEASAPIQVVGLNNWQNTNQLMTVVSDWSDCIFSGDGFFLGIKVLVGKSGRDRNIL